MHATQNQGVSGASYTELAQSGETMASIDSDISTLAQESATVARRGRPRKARARTAGGFIVDKEEIYDGLIIFRRADVQHRKWYCRIKLPKAERYKTISLKTADESTARQLAIKQDMKIQARLEDGIPIFDRPFLSVAREYLATQEERADRYRISKGRVEKMRSILEVVLNDYVGTTQITKIGEETWEGYPAWRRATGRGRNPRNGSRAVSPELAAKLVAQEKAARERARVARKLHPTKHAGLDPREPVIDASNVPFVSDSTIRFEMSIFEAVMNYAIKKKYAPASQRFDDRPKLKVMRRDAFTRPPCGTPTGCCTTSSDGSHYRIWRRRPPIRKKLPMPPRRRSRRSRGAPRNNALL